MPVQTFSNLLDAIKKQEAFTYNSDTKSTTAFCFVLEWYNRTFVNPVTGESITATGGWNIYGPEGDSKDDKESQQQQKTPGEVDLKSVTLLTADSVMGQRIGAKALAGFVDVLCNAVQRSHAEWLAEHTKKARAGN